MKPIACLCLIIFVLAFTGPGFASEETWCPDVIKVDQKAVSPSAEWTVSYGSGPSRLEMVTFFSGPPSEQASLVYDKKARTKGGWTGTWNLPKDSSGYWIQCSYSGTRAELSRRLPASVTVCRVTYDEGLHSVAGLPAIKKIECR